MARSNESNASRIGRTGPRSGLGSSLRVAAANRSVARAQIALAGARLVDLAQLVVVSSYLFATRDAAAVATYLAVRTVAPVFGVPAVTALGSRRPPGQLLLAMAIAAAVGSLTMAFTVASSGPSFAISVSAAVVGVAVGTFRPIVRAMLPTLVRSPAELIATNVTTGVVDSASTLLGPLLGVVVAASVGVPAMLAVTATIVIGAGLAPSRLRPAPSPRRLHGTGVRARLAEHGAGFHELTRTPAARLVVMLGTAQTAVRGAMTVIVVVLVADVLRGGSGTVGGLHAAIGVGGLLALPATMAVVTTIGVHRAVTVGLVLWGTPLVVCAATGDPLIAIGLFAVIGVGDAMVDVGYFGVLQGAVRQRVLTSALGVAEAMFQAGTAVGVLVGAELLRMFGPRVALMSVGILLPVLAGATAARLRSFRHVPAGAAPRSQPATRTRATPRCEPEPAIAGSR